MDNAYTRKIAELEALLKAARDCYEKWKDMPDHGTLSEALFQGDCWQVIEQIGEAVGK